MLSGGCLEAAVDDGYAGLEEQNRSRLTAIRSVADWFGGQVLDFLGWDDDYYRWDVFADGPIVPVRLTLDQARRYKPASMILAI